MVVNEAVLHRSPIFTFYVLRFQVAKGSEEDVEGVTRNSAIPHPETTTRPAMISPPEATRPIAAAAESETGTVATVAAGTAGTAAAIAMEAAGHASVMLHPLRTLPLPCLLC